MTDIKSIWILLKLLIFQVQFSEHMRISSWLTPANCTIHLMNCDTDLDRVRKCFKRLETYTISDNYFQVYLQHHIQNVNLVRQHWSKIVPIILHSLLIRKYTLYWGPWENLTCMQMETPHWVSWLLEHPWQMDLRRIHPPLRPKHLLPTTWRSAYNSIEVGEGSQAAEKENNPSPGFRPITQPTSNNNVQESPQVTHSQGMALLEIQITPGQMILWLTSVNIVDPAAAACNVNTMTTPCVPQSVTPVSFTSTTQVWMDIPVPPTGNTSISLVSTTRVPISQIPSVARTTNTLPSSQPQK